MFWNISVKFCQDFFNGSSCTNLKKKSEKIILLDELNRNVKKPLKLEKKKGLG